MFKLNIIIKRDFSFTIKSLKDFPDIIKKNFPLNLDKKDIHYQDQNLETFVPLHKIVNKVKFTSISKNFLDYLITYKDLSDLCENSLFDKINIGMDKLNSYNEDDNSGIKFKLSFNTDLRKLHFLINLYNIKNYVLIGIDPRKKNINLKMINYYRDIYLQNPIIKNSLRCDIAVNRKLNYMTFEMENHFLYLISQFEYSLIPSKKDSFKLVIDIEDEFNMKKGKHEICLNSIEFKLENILNKISLKEYIKNKSTNDTNINPEHLMKDLVSSEILESKFMIVDVDYIMQGNNIL